MTIARYAAGALAAAALLSNPAHAQSADDIAALRRDMDQLRQDYESRISDLEARLAQAEADASAARAAADVAQAGAQSAPSDVVTVDQAPTDAPMHRRPSGGSTG